LLKKSKKEILNSRQNQTLEYEFWSQHDVIRMEIQSSYALIGHDLASKGVSANEE
jgi:hypothetical protein